MTTCVVLCFISSEKVAKVAPVSDRELNPRPSDRKAKARHKFKMIQMEKCLISLVFDQHLEGQGSRRSKSWGADTGLHTELHNDFQKKKCRWCFNRTITAAWNNARATSLWVRGNWSRLERSPVMPYQSLERSVNSGRDASEVKPLIMITNWSWLLERQAAAVGRAAFEVPPACCRVPGPLEWGDTGTMWLPVGKNVVRRQGDGAQGGWRVDRRGWSCWRGLWPGSAGDGAVRPGRTEPGRMCMCGCGQSVRSLVSLTLTRTHRVGGWSASCCQKSSKTPRVTDTLAAPLMSFSFV